MLRLEAFRESESSGLTWAEAQASGKIQVTRPWEAGVRELAMEITRGL